MIIELILFLPLISCVALIIFKKITFSRILVLVNAFALLFYSLSLYLAFINNSKITSLLGQYFKIDALNILFLLILSIVFMAVSIYSCGYVKSINMHNKKATYYSVGLLLFIFTMLGTVLSSNIALSWVFLEGTTLTSAYLIYFEKTKQSLEATWKYVFICSIGISLGFVGIILLALSTHNSSSMFFIDLYSHYSNFNTLWMNLGFVFFIIGIGTKAGLAPVHSWLPDAHSEAPSPVSALLSGMLLNTALLLVLRYYHILNLADCASYGRLLFLIMGILSIFVTAVYVFTIKNYKRMLAYSSVENMGIISIGLALGKTGVYAALIHLIFHSFAKSSFFMTSGNIYVKFKTKRIDKVSDMITCDPPTGWLWILTFIVISGIPPSPLFISEFLIIKELLADKHYIILVLFILLLTIIMYGIARCVINMTFGKRPNSDHFDYIEQTKLPWTMYAPQFVLLAILAFSGIYLCPFLIEMIKTAAQLI
ncbi:MAG TPA: hypothetical protein DD381_02770 [Lentisphaeria bacterium]|nr:MAG: hypothetical protein A2X47_03485 [Lentisphaerae bacterium GWF2_38_69]HBM15258.1 hypothetical protein [Lentisphaeria bacterium]